MEKIEDDPIARAERAAKYATWWQSQQAKQLHRDRSNLVAKYRGKGGTDIYPDGIHSKSDPWYNPEDWNAKGQWIANHQPPWLTAVGLTLADLKEKPITPANTVADVTKALEKLKAKSDTIKPISEPPSPVTEKPSSVTENVKKNTPAVTENTPSVTINSPVTEIQTPISVTPKPRGRPPSDTALSPAERMRAYRQRLKSTITTAPSS